MIHRSNSSDHHRRILTFPVVHPCQDISTTTLLSSLISLSSQICHYRSHNFVVSRKNVRETIRFVSNFLIVLEEIRDNESVLPESVKLCFFEIHLVFQRILFLLEDFTREGSRLWILMKAERVSIEFRFIIRTILKALNVIQLGSSSIELSYEVREIVDFVSTQAEKAKFQVNPDDKIASIEVISILNHFKNRVIPDPISIKRVLDYLGIKTWNQCNMEIEFMEEEISIESSIDESKEVNYMRNLLGFMIYSRVVIFEFIDENRSGSKSSNLCKFYNYEEIINCLKPEAFLCPISLEIMKNPVTISSGHTFDRCSIKKWFKFGNQICPITGEKLTSTELVPNLVIQKLIRQYCLVNRITVASEPVHKRNQNDRTRTSSSASSKSSSIEEEAMKMVAEFLTYNLSTGNDEDRNKSVSEIRLLGKLNSFNFKISYWLEKSGTIPYILNLLSSLSSSTQENAMGAILNLIKNHKQSTIKRLIVENGGLILILDVLKEGLKIETKQIAATTLFYLCSIEEHRKLIGEIPEVIPSLLELIRDNSRINISGSKSGVIGILGLVFYQGNHKKVIEAGTIKLLIDLLNPNSISNNSSEFITESLAVLLILAEKQEGSLAILRIRSALPKLVGLLESSSISEEAKEYSVSILHSLCINGGSEVIGVLQRPSSLMHSLYNLLTHGTSIASKKASSILRIIHDFNDLNSSSIC